MARNITASELRRLTEDKSQSEKKILLKAFAQSDSSSTFLSHASKDKDLVLGAIEILKNHGSKVYIDEVDPEMPPYTTEKTAALIKQRISQTKRFVLLTSENSKDSRWVPWELGIADGAKGLDKIAIFPASDSMYDDDWVSWEYLGLYRRVVYGLLQGHEKEVWMVLDTRANTAIELRTWLSGY
jgi:hypothetical protein